MRVARILVLLLPLFPACRSAGRPGLFEKPIRTERHGRITADTYQYSGRTGLRSYQVVEVDGEPIDVADGFVEFTAFCEEAGIEAGVLLVRGENDAPGTYILQVDDSGQILTKICPFGPLDPWNGARYEGCDTHWDATTKQRVDPAPQ
jgi:hypothetical protein